MNYTPSTISQRIAAEVRAEMGRQHKQVTLSAMSAETGITHSTLRRSIDGSRSFTLDELERVAAYLGLTIADLASRAREVA